MKTITVRTKRKDEVLDITESVETFLREVEAEEGVCTIFVSHSTCALTTADLDPGTDLDFLDALRFLTRIADRFWERGSVLCWLNWMGQGSEQSILRAPKSTCILPS